MTAALGHPSDDNRAKSAQKPHSPIWPGFTGENTAYEIAVQHSYAPGPMHYDVVIDHLAEVIVRVKSYETLSFDQLGLWVDSGLQCDRDRRCLALLIDHVAPVSR